MTDTIRDKPSGAPGETVMLPILFTIGLAFLLLADWGGTIVRTVTPYVASGVSNITGYIVSFLVLVVCAVFARRLELSSKKVLIVGVCGACVLVGKFLAAFAGFMPAGFVAETVGELLTRISTPIILLLWLDLYCRFTPRVMSITLPAAYFLVGCLYFILLEVNAWVVVVILCLLPFFSALLLVKCLHLASSATESAEGELVDGELAEASASRTAATTSAYGAAEAAATSASGAATSASGASGVRWTFPIYPVILMIIYKFVFASSLPLTEGPSNFGPVGMLLIALVALVGTLFFFDRFTPSLLYKLALPLMVAGLLLEAWLSNGAGVATLLTNASSIGFDLFIFMTLGTVCYRYDVNPIWLLGIVQAASSAATAAGWWFGGLYGSTYPVGSTGADILVACTVVALVALSVLFFNERIVSKTFGTEPRHSGDKPTPAALDADGNPVAAEGQAASTSSQPYMSYLEQLVWRCERVSRHYGLTQREEEILELILQGRSVNRIEEDLCISYNTAKTHVHHIYEKIGVHSRDELEKVIEGF